MRLRRHFLLTSSVLLIVACAEAELTGKEGEGSKQDASIDGGGGSDGGGGVAGTSAGGAGGAAGTPSDAAAGSGGAAGTSGASSGGSGGALTGGTGGATGGTGGVATGGTGGVATGGTGGVATGGTGGVVTGGTGGVATGGTGGVATGGTGGVATGGTGGVATGGTGGTASTCADATKNGSETDVDCGGTSCPKCASGKACGGNADCSSNACAAGKCAWVVTVDSSGNNTFSPSALTISAGGTVRWVWAKGGHTVTGGTGCGNYSGWCSPTDANCSSGPNSSTGATYDHTFATAGTFPYYCRPHCSMMKGTITVQ